MIDKFEIRDIAIKALTYIEKIRNIVSVDEIDRNVENYIFEEIKKVTNNIKFVSEEYGNLTIGDPKQTIIIDPIDGSGNLIRKIPIYAVSIALCDGCLDEVTVENIEYSIVASTFGIYESSSSDVPIQQNIGDISVSEALIRCVRPYRLRLLGASSVELCLLAMGSIDGFIEIRGLKSVDLIPPILILKKHGCYFCDKYGKELKFGLSNPKEECFSIIAARSKDLLNGILKQIKGDWNE